MSIPTYLNHEVTAADDLDAPTGEVTASVSRVIHPLPLASLSLSEGVGHETLRGSLGHVEVPNRQRGPGDPHPAGHTHGHLEKKAKKGKAWHARFRWGALGGGGQDRTGQDIPRPTENNVRRCDGTAGTQGFTPPDQQRHHTCSKCVNITISQSHLLQLVIQDVGAHVGHNLPAGGVLRALGGV